MLRSEHSIVAFENGRAAPDRLRRGRHAQYALYAERMLAVYRSGIGSTRRELHQSIQNLLDAEPDCDRRRIAAFCKLLDDRAEFEKDGRGRAADLRLRVFAIAAKYHPLVSRPRQILERAEHEVKNRVAAEIGMPWSQIDAALYADLIDFQRLKKFDGYCDGAALLARYNVAQLQACLYRAESMSVTASRDFKMILRYAKLARLLHEIRRLAPELYRIDLAGPATVLGSTRRYGISFARFIPALLAFRGWTMNAVVRTPWGTTARLTCEPGDGLGSHMPAPDEFDSSIEEKFANAFGAERGGWRLIREGVILHEGQTTFVPDFVFRNADGREAFMEIVGFWTPEYLEKKRQTLRLFQRHRILLAVAKQFLRKDQALPRGVIGYGRAVGVEPVLRMLETR
jgi:predicted nuclease of restriction endonuclease-like RecB superfamily